MRDAGFTREGEDGFRLFEMQGAGTCRSNGYGNIGPLGNMSSRYFTVSNT